MKTSPQPNILFFLPDQHRPDWLGGNPALPLRTPTLDRLRSRGVHFSNAFTPSPLCSPARACLATGRDYRQCGVSGNSVNTPLALPNYYRRLRETGYQVVGVGKFDLHKGDLDWGLEGSALLREYGFTDGIDNEGKGDAITSYRRNGMSPKGPYMRFLQDKGLLETHFSMYRPYLDDPDWLNFPAVTDLPDEAYCDNWVAANAIRFLEAFPAQQPWHLVVNFVGPHGPFDVTRDMRSRWENVRFPDPVGDGDADPELALMRRQNYAAMIENIDRHVGRIIEIVDQRGELDNTILVYASDHGEMLGDHGRWGKSIWYTPSAGIPLIVAGPGIEPGRCSDALVVLHDLAATFLDYAGVDPLPDADARSLRAHLEGRCATHRDHVISRMRRWNMIFDGRFKCVSASETAPLLFDLDDDPNELHNIAANRPETVTRLLTRLDG